MSAVDRLRQKLAAATEGGDALLKLAKGKLDWSPKSNWV